MWLRDTQILALDRGTPGGVPFSSLVSAPPLVYRDPRPKVLSERTSGQFVAAVWRGADSELQPTVAEAREALKRLTEESSM